MRRPESSWIREFESPSVIAALRAYARAVRDFSPNARRYLVATVLLGVGTSFQWLFFNLYVLSLGHDQAFVGLLASLPALVTAFTALPIGLLLPRIGFRRSLLIGCLLFVTALLGWALHPIPSVLLAGAILAGAASSLLFVASSPLMMAVSTERDRNYLFGVQFGLNTFVGVIANAIGGLLPSLFAGGLGMASEGPVAYRAVLLTATVFAFLALLPIARLRSLGSRHRDRIIGARLILANRRPLLKLLVVQLTVSIGAGMLMPFVNVFYKLRFDLSDPTLGTVFAASSLMTGLAALLAPIFAGRLGKIRMVVLTQALSLPFLAAMGFAPSFGVSAAGFLVRTALMNMSAPVFTAFSMGIVPEPLRPLTSSLLILAWNAGWALSAWLSGKLQVAIGFWPLFVITGSLYALVVVMTHFLFRRTEELTDPVPIVEELHVDEEAKV